jgi:Tol biopolymer transport system component
VNSGDWERVWAAFHAACDLAPEERPGFLQAALPDPHLQRMALDFLDEFEKSGSLDPADAPEPEPDDLSGSSLGRFDILEPIGRGGMGVVYRALDRELDRQVAVKCIAGQRLGTASAITSFVHEARAASALNHPGIVTIHEVIRDGGNVAIVMELAEGRSLRELCGAAQPVERVVEWGRQAAEALAASHAAGIVHRDIKPENLMLRSDGYVKILDFGLARHSGEPMEAAGGELAGTLRYMSPEQAAGQGVSSATDVFSLGIVLRELALGAHPFGQGKGDSSTLTIAQAIAQFDPECVPVGRELPAEFRKLTAAMLDKRPEARPPASEVSRRLADVLARRRRRATLRRVAGGIASAAALAGIVAGYVVSNRQSPVREAPFLEPALLTGAPGGEGDPAFSPDSRWLVYAWDGGAGGVRDLYRLPVTGGDPQRLTSGPFTARNPCWSPDGRSIVFLRNAERATEVAVVPAEGGEPRIVTKLRSDVEWDGKRLTCLGDAESVVVSDKLAGGLSLYRLSLRTGERRLLESAPPGSFDIWPLASPDRREIGFLRLNSQDVDLRVIAPDQGLSRSVLRERGIRSLNWTPDSRRLLAGFGDSNFDRLRMVDVSGGRGGPAPFRVTTDIKDVALSPDGKRAALVRLIRDSNIWEIQAGGGRPRKLGESTRADEEAAYSPDGKSIAFLSNRSGSYEIWIAPVDGARARKITALGGFCGSPMWSPDGGQIAFDFNLAGKTQVHVISSDGAGHRILAPEMDTFLPSWSADGRTVYFSSRRTGPLEIWMIPSNGGVARQVTRHGGMESRESPDGRHLYFTKESQQGIWRMALPPAADTSEEMVMPFDRTTQFRCWDLGKTGLYVADSAWQIRRFPFGSAVGVPFVKLPQRPLEQGRCLSVHPAEKALLYFRNDAFHEEILLADLPK